MSDINGNASQSLSAVARYEHGAIWNRKSMFWMWFALAGNGIGLVLCVISVLTPGMQWGLTGTAWVFILPGLGALARQLVCARRARRIWLGAR